MTSKVVGSSYVEGVGDELLWVLGVGTITMATLVTSTIMLLRQTFHNQQISPHHHGDVQATRRQLGIVTPDHSHDPSSDEHDQVDDRHGTPPGDGRGQPPGDRHDQPVDGRGQPPGDGHDQPADGRGPLPDDGRRLLPSDRNCPICLTEMNAAVETNCGHIFCANCILTYWNINQWPTTACRCPVCRQNVTLLLRCRGHTFPNDIEQQVNTYNRRMAGEPRTLSEWIHDIPTLFRHFLQDLISPRGMMQLWRLRIVVMLICLVLYLLSPLDLLPEAVLGLFGLFDDLLIILIVLFYCLFAYRQAVANIH